MKSSRIPTKYSDKITQTVRQLETNGLIVRFEQGNFHSGICVVSGESILMLNKKLDNTQILNLLEHHVKNYIPTSELA